MPTAEHDPERNAFERDKPGTAARTRAEKVIEGIRLQGGIFVEAVRATRMAMAVTDPTLPGNPIVFANQSFLKLSGYRMDEVLGQQPYFMNGPDTDADDVARFEEALRNDQDDIVETIQYRKDGTRFIASVLLSAFKDENGRTIHHFLSWLDVTRRTNAENRLALLQQAQTALRESEARLSATFESVTAGVATVGMDGRIIRANSEFRRFLPNDIVPSRDPESGHRWKAWDEQGRLIDAEQYPTARALRGERVKPGQEMLYIDDSGRESWAEVASVPTFGDGGKVVGVVTTITDIDERKRASDTLKANERRQAFLLKFTDAIRSEPTEQAVVARATQMLAKELALDRCYATRLHPNQDLTEVVHEVRAPGLAPIPTLLRNSDFPEAFQQTFHGTLIFEDIQNDSALSTADKTALASLNFGALLSRPLRRDGSPIFAVGAVSSHPRHWLPVEIALVEEVAERTWEAAERARSAEALHHSEEKYRTIFSSIDEGFALIEVIFDHDGKPVDLLHLETNPAYERHAGVHDVVGKRALEIAPSFDPMWFDFYGQVARTGEAARIESYLAAPVDRWIALHASQVGGTGSAKVAVVFNDITDRKVSEIALRESNAHQQLLLAELQHRVRNTLAIVRSIAQRTADNSGNVEEMLSHFRGRLDAFSRVQAALTRSVGGTVSLMTLVEDELVAHAAREGERVSIEGPEIMLEVKTAERLSLAIHELTTNAVKHGALTSDKGRIRISWKREPATGSARLLLSWKESGVEVEENPEREGFGMELLLRSLPYDLQAETKVELKRKGLEFDLSMPLREPAEIK